MNSYQADLSHFTQNSHDLKKKISLLHHKLLQVEKNQKRAETILSHIHDGLLFINFQGMITECNRAAASLLNLEEKEILFQPFWESFEDTLFGFSMREMLEKKCDKKRVIITLVQEKKNLQIEINTALIPEEGLILILRDRSEISALERTLRENEQLHALGEMAATLAHEIRNPLGGIAGFASLLLEDVKETPQEEMVKAILEGTHLLNTLVTNVLDYSKPCIIHLAPVFVKECLEQMMLYLGREERKRIVIKYIKNDLILADQMHFTRALLNIVQNGLEASSKRKTVMIEATEGEITITDQGTGIAKEHLDKIMTPFFTTKTRGTGLGLSEVNKILKSHGFSFTIDSSKKGTVVKILF